MTQETLERPDAETAPDGATAGGGERLLVNKRELAKILKCSLPSIDSLIDKYPALPIERRGSNGVEWQFDAEAVTEFIQDARKAEAAREAGRNELLSQFTLPLDDTAPEESKGLSPAQRKAMAEALRIERKMAMEQGLLVPTSEIRQALTGPLVQLGRFLDTLPQQLGRRFNLPDEVVRAMRADIDDARRAFVRGLGALARTDDAS